MSGKFTDETLMAYADGALDADTARDVTAAEAADPEIARRIALFRRTGATLAEARAARPAPEMPDALTKRIREVLEERATEEAKTVVPFGRRAPARPWVPAAIAASLALAVGLGAGLSLRPGASSEPDGAGLAALEASGVAGALSRLASGASEQVAAGKVTVVASFRTPEGRFCREFELASADGETVGVACAEGAGWGLRFAVAMGGADDAGYAPAGGLEALDAWLTGIGAGAPLAGGEEREAMRTLSD